MCIYNFMASDYKSDAYGNAAAPRFIPRNVCCKAVALWVFSCSTLWFANKQSMFFPVLLLLFYLQCLLVSYILRF